MKKQVNHIKPIVPYIALCIIALGGLVLFRYTGLIWADESRERNNRVPVLCPRCYLDIIGSNLTNTNLSYAFMPDATIGSESKTADLRGTNFNNAFLDGVTVIALLSDASFRNASLKGSSITVKDTGPTKINFRNADLTETNLSGDFGGTNLTNANLTSANLSGVKNLSSATVSEVIWSHTICPDGSDSDNNGSTCVGHF